MEEGARCLEPREGRWVLLSYGASPKGGHESPQHSAALQDPTIPSPTPVWDAALAGVGSAGMFPMWLQVLWFLPPVYNPKQLFPTSAALCSVGCSSPAPAVMVWFY